jgi:acetyl-CoA carboxylase biotin carboxyl carrier protein
MDPQQIKVFIDAMASSDLSEMAFSQDGWTLRLVRGPAGAASAASAAPTATPARPASAPRQAAANAAAPTIGPTPVPELLAPLFGVVHLQAGPGEPPYVAAGQAVRAGQTLCVIEAMKVFNEVRAEADAVVDAVLVRSGQEVDAGQPLLRLR